MLKLLNKLVGLWGYQLTPLPPTEVASSVVSVSPGTAWMASPARVDWPYALVEQVRSGWVFYVGTTQLPYSGGQGGGCPCLWTSSCGSTSPATTRTSLTSTSRRH